MSQSAISRIWRAFALQPKGMETFKLSTDPLFIEKIRNIVGLYMNHPERALVLCVDEKSEIQALDRMQHLLSMRLGQAERRTHDYICYGLHRCLQPCTMPPGKLSDDVFVAIVAWNSEDSLTPLKRTC